jgi:hypothetical protein
LLVRFIVAIGLVGGLVAYGPAVSDLFQGTKPAAAQPIATAVASPLATLDGTLSQAKLAGTSMPLSITVTEADLTAAAQPFFPQSYAGITVSDPTAVIRAGAVTFNATAKTFLGPSRVVARGTPLASAGRLVVRIDSATISGVALPQNVQAGIEQQLQAAIDGWIATKLQVSAVTIGQGQLTLAGSALP